MRYRRNIPPLCGKKLWVVRIALLMAVLIGFITVLDHKISPIVQSVAGYQLRVFATKTINEAITEELEREDITYSSLVKISRDRNGMVTDIQTDVLCINRLQARITERVLEALKDPESQELKIPIGSFSGLQLLTGKGPLMSFKIIPMGIVETKIENQFQSAGINQTLHRMMLVVTVDTAAANNVYTVPAEVVTSVCIGETVIVGDIPKAYVGVGGTVLGSSVNGAEEKSIP